MASRFHPLPMNIFPKDVRPYIGRLNKELRDLFALEAVLIHPFRVRRGDGSIVLSSALILNTSQIIGFSSAVNDTSEAEGLG